MKWNVLLFTVLIALLSISCEKNSGINRDFNKILGTYSGGATYDYNAVINGVYQEDNQDMAGTITVAEISGSDLTFKISGSGFINDAFVGYDDEIYTFDEGNLFDGVYFVVNNKEGLGSSRNFSTRFNIEKGTVVMDYDELISANASTERIHFEGSK